MLGAAYANAGRKADAMNLLALAAERARHAYVSPVSVAQVYIGLGEYDTAFEWLERGYHDRDESMTALKVEPAYDEIRSDPRFRDLLRRMKLD
jgi:predicted Zn-dependent protease